MLKFGEHERFIGVLFNPLDASNLSECTPDAGCDSVLQHIDAVLLEVPYVAIYCAHSRHQRSQ